MNDKNRKIITILSIFTIIFTLMGGTLAYWTWTSTEITGVAFTISKEFSCSADGGQDLTSTNIALQPTADCTNSEVALKRTIKVTQNIEKPGLNVNLDMWLKVNDIDPELAASDNLMYAISTVEGSCKKGMDGYINGGNFKGLTTNSQAILLKNKTYTSTTTDTYYLYIWLDAAETNPNTMDKSFDLSLGGACTDAPAPEAPVLDDGMIPVTIANDGTVTMVSETDSSWYNYDNKEWANVVLVNESATDGVENSHPRSYYQNTDNTGSEVTQEDILAYYVWIPRYKYRIPRIKCSDIENPTKEEHYSCYTPPYELLIPYNDFLDVIIDFDGLYYEYCEVNEIFDEDDEWIDDEIICTEENWADMREAVTSYADEMLSTGYSDSWGYDDFGIEELLSTTEYSMKFNKYNLWDRGPETIDIAFEAKEEDMILGNAITEYRTHLAFWWDDDNDENVDEGELLSGIWIGKFESNPEKNSDCYEKSVAADKNYHYYHEFCEHSTQNPTILPNEISLRYQKISNQFYTSKNISKVGNIYGLDGNTINAHMMKNRDWGAVAYLSHSEYGINGNIERNGAYRLLTGCGKVSGGYNGIPRSYNSYGTLLEYPQSTTGNISGIFDMVGGEEFVMARHSATVNNYSGFSPMPESKYYDIYSETIFIGDREENLVKYCTLETCGGHALHETAGWYDTSLGFIQRAQPWVARGEYASIFDTDYAFGEYRSSSNEGTWRSVLVPGFGD